MYRSPFQQAGRTCGSAFKQKGKMWSCGYHTGEDWYCDNHTLVCPADGVIQRNRYDKSYGNYLVIKTDDNRVILMAHMASPAIPPEGSRVSAGDPVGTMGSTGNSTGVHLHIEVENSVTWAYNSHLLKPSDYINFGDFTVKPAPSGGYKVGDHVVFSTCYTSSDAPIEKNIPAAKMARNHGVITRIVDGAKNPYLLDDGLCWVNDGDIRGYYSGVRMGTVATQKKNLNVRASASTDGKILGSFAKGTQVEILGEQAGWYQVRANGLTGWCSAEYIR